MRCLSESILPNLKVIAFIAQVNSRCFLWYPAAILVYHAGTPIWRLQSELYKFGWNGLANHSRTLYRIDLRLGECVYLLIFDKIWNSWLLLLNGFEFIFVWRDSATRQCWPKEATGCEFLWPKLDSDGLDVTMVTGLRNTRRSTVLFHPKFWLGHMMEILKKKNSFSHQPGLLPNIFIAKRQWPNQKTSCLIHSLWSQSFFQNHAPLSLGGYNKRTLQRTLGCFVFSNKVRLF